MYPGDRCPGSQVEAGHESDEEGEYPEIEKQKEQHAPKKKPRRPRDPETRPAARKWAEQDGKINPNRPAHRTAKMNEEGLVINLAKRRASRSKTINREEFPTYNGSTRTSILDLSLLGAALGQQGPIKPELRPVITQLESSLLGLDFRFFIRTRTDFDVAMGELNSMTVCLDFRTDHECTTKELLATPDGSTLNRKHTLFAIGSLKSVCGTDDPKKCPGNKDIAEIIIKAGIIPKSIIVVWHTSSMDLDLFKEFLDSAGYFDILPPKANCIPVIHRF